MANILLVLSATRYVLGPAGYGKTAAIREGINKLRESNPTARICVVAMTSVAADVLGEIGGIRATTFHSWWELGAASLRMHDETYLRGVLSRHTPQLPLLTDVLIVDECSMLTIQVLEVMDRVLRWYRKKPNERFGGLKVVLVGDPMQLPPVAPTAGPGTWRNVRLEVASCLSYLDDRKGAEYIVLQTPHRCTHIPHERMLRDIISRDIEVRKRAMATFNAYHRPGFETIPSMVREALRIDGIILSHKNEIVDQCNNAVRDCLRESGAAEYTFQCPVRLFTDTDVVSIANEDGVNVQEEVGREQTEILVYRKRYFGGGSLYAGTLLQIRANHTSKNGVDCRIGDLCKMVGQDEDGNAVMVRLKDKQELVIGLYESKSEYWPELRWEGFPFIQANAATVHLVQGSTIYTPVIFHSDIGEGNDIYGDLPFYLNVAASRVTNPANFILTHPMSRYALVSVGIQKNLETRWDLSYMIEYPK
jgi:hypothetical protein